MFISRSREGQNQEIQTVGRLDSGCREQDYIPQIDNEQTADNVHQELRIAQEQNCQISGPRRPESSL